MEFPVENGEIYIKSSVEVNNAIDLPQREQRYEKIMPVEISTFKELVIVLEPFHEALEAVEGEKKVTITATGPVIQGLKHSLEKKRWDPYMEMRDVQVAAFLDPRFKLDWLLTQEQKD